MKNSNQFMFTLLFAVCVSLNASGVDWREDYISGLKEAEQTSRPVFILFTNTKTCSYCINADKWIFSRYAFNKFCKNDVIPIRVNYAPLFGTGKKVNRSDFKRIKDQLNIPSDIKTEGWPYIVLISPDGKILHQSTERDSKDARVFIRKYQDIIRQSK
jgi:thioredoxin-related protein